jgi:flagellar basal-body rod modification protein FlgD
MPTTPITSGSSNFTAPANDRIANKSLGQQDFIKLLTVQLANQDISKPQDSGALLNQMTQIASMQSMSLMQESMTRLKADQQVSLGQSLINKMVQVADPSGALVTGVVEKVTIVEGAANLYINEQNYPVSTLQAVL